MESSNVPSWSCSYQTFPCHPRDNDPRRAELDEWVWVRDATLQNIQCGGQHKWDKADNKGVCKHFEMGRCDRGFECSFLHPRYSIDRDGERTIYGAWHTKAHRYVCRRNTEGQHCEVTHYGYDIGRPTTCLPAPTFGNGDLALGFALQAHWHGVFYRAEEARMEYLRWLYDGLERIEATLRVNPRFFRDAVTNYLTASEQLPPFPRFRKDSPDALRAFNTFEKAFNSEYAYMRGVLQKWSTSPVKKDYTARKFRDTSKWSQNVHQQILDTAIPGDPIVLNGLPGPSHAPTPLPTPEEPSSTDPAEVDEETQAYQEELPPFHPSKIGPPKEVLSEESSPSDVKGKGKEKEVLPEESSSTDPAEVDRETQTCEDVLLPFHLLKIGPAKEVLSEESSPSDVKGKGKEKEVLPEESSLELVAFMTWRLNF